MGLVTFESNGIADGLDTRQQTMSRMQQLPVDCPRCGVRSNATVHESVNVTLDRSLKQRVLSGELFQWCCPRCGQECTNGHPLLYHDMEQRLLIRWVAPEYAGTPERLRALLLVSEASADWPELGGEYRCRLVRDLDDLIEKIYVFDTGLDDRAIEWLKFSLKGSVARAAARGNAGVELMEPRFVKPVDAGGERRLQFVGPAVLKLPGSPGMPLSSMVPFSSYERALVHLESCLPLPEPVNGRFVVVDQSFIAQHWETLPDIHPEKASHS